MPRSGPGPVTGALSTQDRAFLDRQKAADQIKQSRFAAAGWPEQRDEFAVCDFERHLIERQHLAAALRAIHVADAVDDDLRLTSHGVFLGAGASPMAAVRSSAVVAFDGGFDL